jgi:hypothetical protein
MALTPGYCSNLTKGSPPMRGASSSNKPSRSRPSRWPRAMRPARSIKRDREIGALDHFLSSSGWDLWQAFGDSGVERTSDRLARWWAEPYSAKAVLILDGLSPARTALAACRAPRSAASPCTRSQPTPPNCPAKPTNLPGAGLRQPQPVAEQRRRSCPQAATAQTECVDMPWKDCEGLINSAPRTGCSGTTGPTQAARRLRRRPGAGAR